MAGPCFVGYIVEKWRDAALPQVLRAIAGTLENPEGSKLRVHAHQGSAWLDVDDPRAERGRSIESDPGLARAIARAAGSPVWAYTYKDRAGFSVEATRYLADGTDDVRAHADDDTEVPDDVEDAARHLQDLVGKAIRKHVKWAAPLLRTGATDYAGPAITGAATTTAHALDVARDEPEDAAESAPAVRDEAPIPQSAAERRKYEVATTLQSVVDEGRAAHALLTEAEEFLELGEAVNARGMEPVFSRLCDALEKLAEHLAERPLDEIPLGLSPALEKMVNGWEQGKARASVDETLGLLRSGMRAIERRQLQALQTQVLEFLDGKAAKTAPLRTATTCRLKRVSVRLAWLALRQTA